MADLKPEFGYVMGVGVASALVHHFYMGVSIAKARKKYGVKYPDLYATKDNCADEASRKTFNCIQRGHQNCLEVQPIFLSLLTLAGLKFPVTAAGLGVSFLVGRISYFQGYSTGDPDKRMNPGTYLYPIGLLGLMGTVITAAVKLLRN